MTIRELLDTAAREEMNTVRELAAYLRINERTIHRHIKSGDLPGVVRVGREYRLHRRTVLAYYRKRAEATSV